MTERKSAPRLDTVYGINAVREVIGTRSVDYVLIANGHRGPRVEEIIQACRAAGISPRFAPRVALDRAAGTPAHQNVVAVCTAKAYDDLQSLVRSGERALLVALDGVEDPANLGAIIRTAVAAGAGGLIIPERRAVGLSPAVARTAAGALEHVKVARVTNFVRTLMDLKKQNLWVYGFEAGAEKSYLDLDYAAACVVVLGGEGRGLHRLVRETCDQLAHIPLKGPVQSLNVSVAAGVVLYEAMRQRTTALAEPRAS
jgi:23S rRNA (guanosine2251-2'-O)-methyltransferase